MGLFDYNCALILTFGGTITNRTKGKIKVTEIFCFFNTPSQFKTIYPLPQQSYTQQYLGRKTKIATIIYGDMICTQKACNISNTIHQCFEWYYIMYLQLKQHFHLDLIK